PTDLRARSSASASWTSLACVIQRCSATVINCPSFSSLSPPNSIFLLHLPRVPCRILALLWTRACSKILPGVSITFFKSFFDQCFSFWLFLLAQGLLLSMLCTRPVLKKRGVTMKVANLRSFLGSWPYHSENNGRVTRGADGREIILVRQQMGLEEYEIDGRPDGRRIQGMESVFAFHHARLDAAKQTNAANGLDFRANDCAWLFDEGVLY